MRILVTSFTYYPQTNGVAIATQTLAESLVANGHDVAVATCYQKGLKKVDNFHGVKLYRFNFNTDILKRPIGEYRKYIEFVSSYQKDCLILECIQCFSTDILLPYISSMNCKIILHSHGGPGIDFPFFRWEGNLFHSLGHIYNWFYYKYYYGYFFKKYAKFIDKVLCLSLCASDLKYMNEVCKSVGLLENPANDIFFNEENYDTDTTSILSITKSKYILCISNFTPNKRQSDIVSAFSQLKDEDCSLVLVGSTPNSSFNKVSKLAKRVMKKTGKEILILTGVNRFFFPSLIYNATLFVMASEHEEYPISLVESMACGTPFVSTNAGCSRLLPGGVTVVSRDDLATFINMVESNLDIRKKLSRQGKEYALNCNTTRQYSKLLEEHIKSIL